MAFSATALVSVMSAATDKNVWKIVLIAMLAPMTLIIIITAMFLQPGAETNDAYFQAVQQLIEEENVNSTIASEIFRGITIFYTGDILDDVYAARQLIEENFLVDYDYEVTNEDGTIQTYTATRFMEFSEICLRLKDEPFHFNDEQLAFLQIYNIANGVGIEDGSNIISNNALLMPCVGSLSSPWGYRTHPITDVMELHTGLDIVGEWHRPVYAAADGIVVSTSTHINGYGNHVMIKHDINGQSFYTFYAHLSKISIKQGETVTAGKQIGNEGGDPQKDVNPGTSTGHHLHFEVRLDTTNKKTVNPLLYLKR